MTLKNGLGKGPLLVLSANAWKDQNIRLWVVPHFSSGIVERRLFSRGVIFTRARVSPFLTWGDFHARLRFARSTIPEETWGTSRSLTKPGHFGCFSLCQNFRKFRTKRKWNGSARVEIFRSKRSTSRGGHLWPVGPVRQIFRNFHFQTACSSSSLHPVVKMADDSDLTVY